MLQYIYNFFFYIRIDGVPEGAPQWLTLKMPVLRYLSFLGVSEETNFRKQIK